MHPEVITIINALGRLQLSRRERTELKRALNATPNLVGRRKRECEHAEERRRIKTASKSGRVYRYNICLDCEKLARLGVSRG